MFVPDDKFKSIILGSLKEEDKSISSLQRALKEEGYNVHRLILTGYLRAMEELNVLKVKDIPPSKVYSLPMISEMDIYETIGEHCMQFSISKDERIALAVYTLQRTFRRPIFLEEIEKTGLGSYIGDGVKKITSEERMEIKRVLTKRGIKTRYNDPAYKADQEFEQFFNEITNDIIIDKFKIGKLLIDTKQMKLGV